MNQSNYSNFKNRFNYLKASLKLWCVARVNCIYPIVGTLLYASRFNLGTLLINIDLAI